MGMQDKKVTIVVPTYNRNVHFECDYFPLYKLAQDDFIDKMIIIWNNIGESIPDSILNVIYDLSLRDKIEFITPTENKLINKFKYYDHIKTDAVLYLDDDIDISINNVKRMYDIFIDNRYSIIGPVARRCDNNTYAFSGDYNTILTDCSMIDKSILSSFYEHPLFNDIDKIVSDRFNNNGEDIAFNFVISDINDVSSVMIKVPVNCLWQPRGSNTASNGISNRPNHNNNRILIVNELIKLFGYNPLKNVKVL